jgi:2-polyprenyl-6-methoxyphenol hydroxylase-like FAD-dependent oxidoreductase
MSLKNLAMTTPERKTIAIIGAAIAGPTLALQILSHPLLRARYRPLLFDAAPAPGTDPSRRLRAGASVCLFASGIFPLRRLGLDDAIRAKGFECDDVIVWQGAERLNAQRRAMRSRELDTGVWYFERSELQALLLEKLAEMGGEDVCWGKKATGFEQVDGRMKVDFDDGTDVSADILVGADGGYSAVRRHILQTRSPATAEQRWLPDFMGMTGIYGVSDAAETTTAAAAFADTHAIWLDRGFLATGPCPAGRTRWDLIIPEAQPPPAHEAAAGDLKPERDVPPWSSNILPSQYPLADTIAILEKHEHVPHPYAGTLGDLVRSADRIIHTPLRQRVWRAEEIQAGNVVLIGDASRLLLPTSGSGTGFAVEDATVLADLLVKYADADDGLRLALEEYARLRVPRSSKMAAMSNLAGRFALGEAWYYRYLRYYMYKWMPSKEYHKEG